MAKKPFFIPENDQKNPKQPTPAIPGSCSQPFRAIFQIFRPLSSIEIGIQFNIKKRKQLSLFTLLFKQPCAYQPVAQVVWRVGCGGGDLAGGEERRPWGGRVRRQAHFHIKLGAAV